jgi:CRISPR-associated protein Cmr5
MQHERDRARSAFTHVQARQKANPKEYQDAYVSQARELGILVRRAGLLQAIEFVNRSKKPAHKDLLEDVAKTVLGKDGTVAKLLEKSRAEMSLAEYRHLTRELIATANWYRRYADSIMKAEKSSPQPQPTEAQHA